MIVTGSVDPHLFDNRHRNRFDAQDFNSEGLSARSSVSLECFLASTNLFKKNNRAKKKAGKRIWPAVSKYYSELDKVRYGSLGPASPVRRIDPVTGEVIAIIPAR